MGVSSLPARIRAVAPLRICDCGGWTDTWFAQHGTIFNIGVAPFAMVEVEVHRHTPGAPRVLVHAEDYGAHFEAVPGNGWPHHPLIEACIERLWPGIPNDVALEISLHCDVPAGAAAGTSASVSVALLAALDALQGGTRDAYALAREAHAVETDMLGRQCGVQDQLCAAFGGINAIDMHAYPQARVRQLHPAPGFLHELEHRLALVFLGKSHDSSAVHEKVIRELENAGPSDARIEGLRAAARQAIEACEREDFAALGDAMRVNTAAQAALNPALVSPDAQHIIEIAQAHGAIGWKVNGAGGDGGSITLLGDGNGARKRAMLRAIEAALPGARHIPIRLSPHGARVWRS
jgi:D-glycero-alpha-D-manno-heptose-7-phosphate kinase